MNKRDFFLAAMKAEEFRRRAWVISAFSLINEGADAWKEDPYPYRVVQTPTGHFFVDPTKDNELTKISDAKAGQPPILLKERLIITKADVPNAVKETDTTYGNVLVNFTLLVAPFGAKMPYMEGRISPGQIEKLILPRLKDTPPEGEVRDDKFLYVDEYLEFADAAFSLVAFTQMCVPAATEKTMTAADGIEELKARLLEENKDRLHDPATIAKIDAALVAHDRAWMKGDPGEDFLIKSKSFDIVRKKQYSMHGAEVGLSESVDVTLIPGSLADGWDLNHFPAMNDSLRAGSFNRGHQTMLGGEEVKWLFRVASNINIKEGDCGSTMGIDYDVTGDNYDWIVGFSLIEGKGVTLVPDKEAAQKYIGKKVTVRSLMYCWLEETDYCTCCAGQRLATNPTGAATAIAGYGSAFLAMFMAAAHGKKLSLAKLDWKASIF